MIPATSETCPQCSGKGYQPTNYPATCKLCKGLGITPLRAREIVTFGFQEAGLLITIDGKSTLKPMTSASWLKLARDALARGIATARDT